MSNLSIDQRRKLGQKPESQNPSQINKTIIFYARKTEMRHNLVWNSNTFQMTIT